MLSALLVAALAGISSAIPAPQGIEIPAAVAAADPVLYTVPLDVDSNVPQAVAPAPVEPITTGAAKVKRDASPVKRDGTCATQPTGSGPVPSPDTVAAFQADPDLQVCFLWHPLRLGY